MNIERKGHRSNRRFLRKALWVFSAALVFTVSGPWNVWGQQAISTIGGTVLNPQLNPVPGVKISVRDPSGKTVGEAVTDAGGRYCLENVAAGQYQLNLDPLLSPFKGETVVASLGPQNLLVDWFISKAAEAIAAAMLGTASCRAFETETTRKRILAGTQARGWVVGVAAEMGAFTSDKPWQVYTPSR